MKTDMLIVGIIVAGFMLTLVFISFQPSPAGNFYQSYRNPHFKPPPGGANFGQHWMGAYVNVGTAAGTIWYSYGPKGKLIGVKIDTDGDGKPDVVVKNTWTTIPGTSVGMKLSSDGKTLWIRVNGDLQSIPTKNQVVFTMFVDPQGNYADMHVTYDPPTGQGKLVSIDIIWDGNGDVYRIEVKDDGTVCVQKNYGAKVCGSGACNALKEAMQASGAHGGGSTYGSLQNDCQSLGCKGCLKIPLTFPRK